MAYDHALSAVSFADKLFTCRGAMRLDSVEYINVTGFVGHATIHWTIELLKGATVMASWTTDSDIAGQGTIAADTFVDLVNSATDANLVAASGDEISLNVVETGAAADLPAGRIVIHARYI